MSAERWRVGSLCSGIGGIDLGMEWTGLYETTYFVEPDPYCQRVLRAHWPEVPIYNRVEEIDADAPLVDVIAAGFPCQPVSRAGSRGGDQDERWLWPEVLRCVRLLRPRGVLLENVSDLLSLGLGDVIGGLAACGYDAEWDCIPAAAVGAPHLRDRVFIIATPGAELRRDMADGDDARYGRDPVLAGRHGARHGGQDVADADGPAGAPEEPAGEAVPGSGAVERSGRRGRILPDLGWPSPMADAGSAGSQGGGDGRSAPDGGRTRDVWATEPPVGRVAHGIPSRVDRLRCLGNAVVPQVAQWVAEILADRMRHPLD